MKRNFLLVGVLISALMLSFSAFAHEAEIESSYSNVDCINGAQASILDAAIPAIPAALKFEASSASSEVKYHQGPDLEAAAVLLDESAIVMAHASPEVGWQL